MDGGLVSRLRPPWLLSRMPSRPDFMARMASSADIIPFRQTGRWVCCRTQARSSQVSPGSMNPAITRPSPPPFLSLRVVDGDMGTVRLSSALTRSSASRLPGQAASTVTKMALMFGLAEHLRSSSADFSRSRFTYNWKIKFPDGAAPWSSSIGNDELFDT